MTDEYTLRTKKNIMVLDGNRKGSDRRSHIDRRSGKKHNIRFQRDTVQRENDRRNTRAERRVGIRMTDTESILDRVGTISLSILFGIIGFLCVVTGLTFLPGLGLAFGAGFFAGSFFFMFSSNKHSKG